jgi:cytochrome c oxidase subunit IV
MPFSFDFAYQQRCCKKLNFWGLVVVYECMSYLPRFWGLLKLYQPTICIRLLILITSVEGQDSLADAVS